MGFNIVEMHHVDILMVKIEKIYFVDQFRAVERTFLDDRDVKTKRISVDRARADAARSALAAYNQTADTKEIQMREERCSLKNAGALLVDDDVGRQWRELFVDAMVCRVCRLF